MNLYYHSGVRATQLNVQYSQGKRVQMESINWSHVHGGQATYRQKERKRLLGPRPCVHFLVA